MPARFLALLSCFLCFLYPACLAAAQDDAAVASRRLLYHPALGIEPQGDAVLFRAAQFTYIFDRATQQWQVRRETNAVEEFPERVRRYRCARLDAEFRFSSPPEADQQAVLTIYGSAGSEPLAQVALWDRTAVARALLAELRAEDPELTLAEVLDEEDFELSGADVAAVADDGAHLWLAIRHYAGEGLLGLAAVVRFDPQSYAAQVHYLPLSAGASVSAVAVAGGAVWLGTHRYGEGGTFPEAGLLRLDPATGAVRRYSEGQGPLGALVTALAAEGDALWLATDAALCRGAAREDRWHCWRVVPMVELAAAAPLSDRPGGETTRQLPPGRYEVRFVEDSFLEVVTPDAVEGWMRRMDYENHARHGFDARPYHLALTYGGGAAPLQLLASPAADRFTAPVAYRVALEALGEPDLEGWQRLRARFGWLPAEGLEVVPVILPAGQ